MDLGTIPLKPMNITDCKRTFPTLQRNQNFQSSIIVDNQLSGYQCHTIYRNWI